MWGGSRLTGNSALEIQLRQKKVLANRERGRVSRAASVLERHWSQNFRKLSSLERSLFVLMGKDPYPNCPREDALFEYNQPGFCYRRDGAPRFMRSLQESKSRKIVNDLEGREGLSPEPALNVVSDNPKMAELLSIPELVGILCELRNTAAIMSNEGLFFQFATALQNSSRNPLTGFDGPLDYLKQYRKNLIQEFFDTLESETEMRFSFSKADPNLSFKNEDVLPNLPSDLQDLMDGSQLATRRQSAVDVDSRDVEEWNKAVIEGIRKAQEDQIKFGRRGTPLEDNSQDQDPNWTLHRYMNDVDNLPPLFSDKALGLLTSKYLEESRKDVRTPAGAKTPPTTPRGHPPTHPDSKRAQKQKRVEFDNFVRHLISKIEILDEMGQNMLAFRRKRPNRHASLIEPLVKLLKKPSLFSSLTDADLQESLDNASDNNDTPKIPSSTVKYFKVPNSPEMGPSKTSVGSNRFSNSSFPQSSSIGMRPSIQKLPTARIEDLDDAYGKTSTKHVHFLDIGNRPTSSSIHPTTIDSCASTNGKSSEGSGVCSIRHRLRCRACRERVKQACAQLQQRDAICSKTKDVYAWKIPELSNWPHEYKEPPTGIRARESVRSLSEIRRKEKMAKSVYLIPAPKSVSFQKGAPTPRFPRRSTISQNLSAFSFKNGNLRFGEDMMSTFALGLGIGVDSTVSGNGTKISSEGTPITSGSKTSISGKKTVKTIMTRRGSSAVSGVSSTLVASVGVKSKVASGARKVHSDSWTLQVSKLDIMKLRHELETETVKDKMLEFEQKFLNP